LINPGYVVTDVVELFDHAPPAFKPAYKPVHVGDDMGAEIGSFRDGRSAAIANVIIAVSQATVARNLFISLPILSRAIDCWSSSHKWILQKMRALSNVKSS
jgi:hypothetical protein